MPPVSAAFLLISFCAVSQVAAPTNTPTPGDARLAVYFKAETARLEAACLADITSIGDWNSHKAQYRQQLFEMLGLSPLPPRTDLKPVITGKLDHEEFTVEKLHYQSMPGFYVTANLYVPKGLSKPAPAILYVCGHAVLKTNGVSLGNKAGYQHHGAWFARNGYVCLTIDTVQLGELEGLHHGTYREGMWWWNSRGYTPAGAEAWSGIRALDYLQSRPEVDGTRIGVTGRSGGGAYSWWIAALDERIKAACPVAGITDLHNHVVDGVVQGHCDCMFMVNTYRWDYAQVAALVAPRPLLICNTDKDPIFPLEGVTRLHEKVRNIYRLHNAGDKLGLLITEGPHKDTQDLQVPVFRWFNRYLKGEEPLIAMPAEKLFNPADLRVLSAKPADERTTKIHETFVPVATATAPKDAVAWAKQAEGYLAILREKSFLGWPAVPGPLHVRMVASREAKGTRLRIYDFDSQEHVQVRLYELRALDVPPKLVSLDVQSLAEFPGWMNFLVAGGFGDELAEEKRIFAATGSRQPAPYPEKGFESTVKRLAETGTALLAFTPRGVGIDAWNPPANRAQHIPRRFMLLGQTTEAMRTWDIRRAVQAVQEIDGLRGLPVQAFGHGSMAVNVLYASLFERGIRSLSLHDMPASHATGPDYLNVLRFLDVPQAVAMAASHKDVKIFGPEAERAAGFARAMAPQTGGPAQRITTRASVEPR